MNGFLERLERLTERWIRIMDEQLHETTVRTIDITFTMREPSTKVTAAQEQIASQDTVVLAPRPVDESHKPETGWYPPVLKKAPASSK